MISRVFLRKGIRDILNVKGLSLNLTHLNLANNKIDLLPESFFAQCSSLKHLNLSNNRIHVVPNGISQLKYLTWLNLGLFYNLKKNQDKYHFHSGPENLKKSRPKKLVKSNK